VDGGETWILCKLNHRENPTKYGKYWCWCFWDVEIDVTQLLGTKELVVHAWDAAMNTQPKDFTWNVMGTMNNSWFHVKLSICKHKEGGISLVFEHPTENSRGTSTNGMELLVRDR
jgi:nitrate reductase (NAD(P)H)